MKEAWFAAVLIWTTCTGRLCRGAHCRSYVAPRLRTKIPKFGQRAFSFSGPGQRHIWNSLLADLRTVSEVTDFSNKLKTHLFMAAQ